MRLSDEQMRAVQATTPSKWSVVELPTGRQELPAWLIGAHIYWGSGVSNSPRVLIKTNRDISAWPDKRFKKIADMYLAESSDGRAIAHYHNGTVSKTLLVDPKSTVVPFTDRPKIEVMATTRQNGYGGSDFWITMEDGTALVLRGPWHGGPPPGYVEVTTVDASSPYNRPTHRDPRPWWKRGGSFGVCITEELFLKTIATFQPHAEVVRVEHSYGARLEPKDANWYAPKHVMYEDEQMRAVSKLPASKFWRIYWDARGSYCGTLTIPMYGYEEGVTDVV